MTTKTKLATALIAIGTLAACSKLLWMQKYNDIAGDNFSESRVVATDSAGNAYMGGYVEDNFTSERIPFIVKYDASGKLVWDRRLPVTEGVDSYRGIEAITLDQNGNIYAVGGRWIEDGRNAMAPEYIKLDPSGEILWRWMDPEKLRDTLVFDLHIGADGNIYSPLFYTAAYLSLSSDGEFRWLKSANQAPSMGDELGGDDRGLESYKPNAVNPVAGKNQIILTTTGTLKILDLDGTEKASFEAASLQLVSISYALENDTSILIVGKNSDNHTIAKLLRGTTSGYTYDDSASLILDEFASELRWVPHQDGGFCFASKEATQIISGGIDGNLQLKWKNEHTAAHAHYPVELINVKSDSNNCYTQFIENYAHDRVVSVVLSENKITGKTNERVQTEHFAAFNFVTQGNNIYQTGITGPYTTEIGTSATLFKHWVK